MSSNTLAGSETRISWTVPHEPALETIDSSELDGERSPSASSQSYRYSDAIERSSAYVSADEFMNLSTENRADRTSRPAPAGTPASGPAEAATYDATVGCPRASASRT